MTRVSKPSVQMVTPTPAPLSLERCAKPTIGFAPSINDTSLVARFRKDTRGATAIMFGLLIMPVMFLTGMAVDFSRMVTAKGRMQTAMDAAALAGVRAAQTNTSSSVSLTVMETAAQNFYTAITSGFRDINDTRNGSSSNNVSVVLQSDGSYKFTLSTWIRTPFLSIVGSNVTGPNNTTGAPSDCVASKFKCQQVAVSTTILPTSSGQNIGYSIETAFMLDITGSMSGQKLEDLKVAANNAIDTLVWADQTKQTSRVAIVPFAADVRMPTSKAFLAATGRDNGSTSCMNAGGTYNSSTGICNRSIYGYTFSTKNTEYCVVERTGTNKYTQAAPASGSYSMVEWIYRNGRDSNVHCNVPSAAAVQPLTSDKTTLHNLINGLQTAGTTAGHIGTAWAWYMLSPNFNALWETENQAGAYDTATNPADVKLRKIAVLMTDGDYNTEYTTQGIPDRYFGESPANDYSSAQAASVCTNIKSAGIEVYTVAFSAGDGLSNSAKTLLTNCATDASHFYDAGTGTALNAAFQDIALKIAKIRISG